MTNQKAFTHIFILFAVLLVIVVIILIFLSLQASKALNLSPDQKTPYQNPFSQTNQYQNPFETYQNPFDQIKQ